MAVCHTAPTLTNYTTCLHAATASSMMVHLLWKFSVQWVEVHVLLIRIKLTGVEYGPVHRQWRQLHAYSDDLLEPTRVITKGSSFLGLLCFLHSLLRMEVAAVRSSRCNDIVQSRAITAGHKLHSQLKIFGSL